MPGGGGGGGGNVDVSNWSAHEVEIKFTHANVQGLSEILNSTETTQVQSENQSILICLEEFIACGCAGRAIKRFQIFGPDW